MPTYDYKCPKCKKIEQHLHKMSEDLALFCIDCDSIMLKCIGGGIGVHFKGSGFYETDYKGK